MCTTLTPFIYWNLRVSIKGKTDPKQPSKNARTYQNIDFNMTPMWWCTFLVRQYHNTYVWSFLKLIMIEHIKLMKISYLDGWSMLLSRKVSHRRIFPCQVTWAWIWPISEFDKNLASCCNIRYDDPENFTLICCTD